MTSGQGSGAKRAAGVAKGEAAHDVRAGKRQAVDGAAVAQRHPDRAAHEVERDVQQHPRAVAGGAAPGAAAGGLFGGPPGAIFGGLFGAVRGLAAADAFDVVKKRFARRGEEAGSKGE